MSENTRPKVSVPRPARPKPAAKPEKTTEGERIAKTLSRAGIASRREAERLIEAGEVQVNGKTITSAALNVTATDRITVSGQPVGAPEPARLWLYYKPEGLVTSASDEKGRETVFDHLPEDMPRVMSIGRLDLNSEGLLLLTNDGGLKRTLELPSTGWLRKYRVRVKGNPTDPELEPLRRGITVDGDKFQPMEVVLDRHQGSNAWLTVGLREGKNREIRRAINAIGMIVNRLIRISYGPFRLNDLQPGDVEEIRARILRDQLGPLMPGGVAPEEDAPTKAAARRPGAKPTIRTTARTGGERAEAPRTKPGAKPAADAPAPGKVTTPKGRAGLNALSKTWASATGRVDAGRPETDDGRPKPPTRGRTYKPKTQEGPASGKPAGKPSGKTAGKPIGKPTFDPAGKPTAKPMGRPPGKSGPKKGARPSTRNAAKPPPRGK